ncbi:MAG: acyltransferase [Pseudomonadota bacterium]
MLPQKTFVPGLDTLRGIAVLVVMLGHVDFFFFGRGIDYLSGGFIGVDLFFVISGFLITRNLLSDLTQYGSIRLKRFYWHRVLRLLPALLLLLTVLTPILYLLDLADQAQLRSALLALVFYVYNWFVFFTLADIPGFGHLWSLSVEEQFYFLWPLLLLLFAPHGSQGGRKWAVCCLLLIAVVAAVRLGFWSQGSSWLQLYLRTDLRADALLGGALLAFWGRGTPLIQERSHPSLLGGIALLIFLAASCLLDNEAPYMYQGGFSILAVYCVMLVGITTRGALGAGIPGLEGLGRISYGVYLYHMPVVLLFSSSTLANLMPSEGLRVVLSIMVSIGIAALSFHAFEKKFARYKKD